MTRSSVVVTRAIVGVGIGVGLSVVSSGCWPDWQRFFDTTISTEHRVEDTRVLAMEVVADNRAVFVDVVDPRGGSATVSLRLCLRPRLEVPCDDDGVFVDEVNVSYDDATHVGRANVAFDVAAAFPDVVVDASPAYVDVIADVVADGRSAAEHERATLTVPIYDDSTVASADDSFAVCVDPTSPDENPVCSGEVPFGECGNGVVDEGEVCDPPGEGDCDDVCQAPGGCPRFTPACIESTPRNIAPHIAGLRTGDAVVDTSDLPVDGATDEFTVDVPAGGRLRLQPVVNVGAHDAYQPWFSPVFGGDESCGEGLIAGCATTEFSAARFYVVDDNAIDLVSPGGDTGFGVNDNGFTAVDVVVSDGASGEFLVYVVVADGRGGMGFQPVTVRVR